MSTLCSHHDTTGDTSLNLFPCCGCLFPLHTAALPAQCSVTGGWCVRRPALPQHNTTDWVAPTTEECVLTALEAGNPRSRCRQGWLLLRPLSLACRPLPSHRVGTWPLLRACASLVPLPLLVTVQLDEGCILMTSFKPQFPF